MSAALAIRGMIWLYYTTAKYRPYIDCIDQCYYIFGLIYLLAHMIIGVGYRRFSASREKKKNDWVWIIPETMSIKEEE